MRKYLTRGILGIGAIALVLIALAAMTSQFTGGATAQQNPCVPPGIEELEAKLDAMEVKLDTTEAKLDATLAAVGDVSDTLATIEVKLDEIEMRLVGRPVGVGQ